MRLNNALASVAAGALAISPAVAAAQDQRTSQPTAQSSQMNNEAAIPWPVLIVGLAALIGLILVLVDGDDEAAISA